MDTQEIYKIINDKISELEEFDKDLSNTKNPYLLDLIKKRHKELEELVNENVETLTFNPYSLINNDTHITKKSEFEKKVESAIRQFIIPKQAQINVVKFLGTTENNKTFTAEMELKFECSEKHTFTDTYKKIREKEGKICCPNCKTDNDNGKVISFSERGVDKHKLLSDFAANYNIELLTDNFIDYGSQHEFKCPEGHTFKRSAKQFNEDYKEFKKTGKDKSEFNPFLNCCVGCKDAPIISEAKEIIGLQNGTFIKNEQKKGEGMFFTVKCDNKDHNEFEISKKKLFRGIWCGCCKREKGESNSIITEYKVKMFVEMFFMDNFQKAKEKWNVNHGSIKFPTLQNLTKYFKTKRQGDDVSQFFINRKTSLELDIYNERLKTAFEYNGSYHTKYVTRISNIEERIETLVRTQQRDLAKITNCQKQGVDLFVIPRMTDYDATKFDRALKHFITHCEKQGLEISYTEHQKEYMKKNFLKAHYIDDHMKNYKKFLKSTKYKSKSIK